MNFRFHKLYDYRARQRTSQNSNKYHKRIIGYKRNTIQKMKNEWISQRFVEYFPKKNKILPPPRFTYINNSCTKYRNYQ